MDLQNKKIINYKHIQLKKFKSKKLIKNKRTNKSFFIYCLQNNKKSTKGILNVNFILKNKITRLRNV